MLSLIRKMIVFGLLQKNDISGHKIVIDFNNLYFEIHKKFPNEIESFAYLQYIRNNQ